MWWQVRLAAADAGRLPITRDGIVISGPDLASVLTDVVIELGAALDQCRRAKHPKLQIFLTAGLEVERWQSAEECRRHGGEADEFRRAMRDSVLRSPCSSIG